MRRNAVEEMRWLRQSGRSSKSCERAASTVYGIRVNRASGLLSGEGENRGVGQAARRRRAFRPWDRNERIIARRRCETCRSRDVSPDYSAAANLIRPRASWYSVQPRKLWRPGYSHFDARPRLHFIGEPVFRLVSDPHGQMSSEGRDGCGGTVSISSSVSPFAVVIVRMIGDRHEITSVSVRL
jgi:hypothetical protein